MKISYEKLKLLQKIDVPPRRRSKIGSKRIFGGGKPNFGQGFAFRVLFKLEKSPEKHGMWILRLVLPLHRNHCNFLRLLLPIIEKMASFCYSQTETIHSCPISRAVKIIIDRKTRNLCLTHGQFIKTKITINLPIAQTFFMIRI